MALLYTRQREDRDMAIRILVEEYPGPVDTEDFTDMFDKICLREDIPSCDIHLILRLFVDQAFLHLAKWGAEIGYARKLEGSRSDTYFPVKYDYDSDYDSLVDGSREDREMGREDCIAWFGNTNYVDRQDATRYGVPLLTRFSWLTLDIAKLVAEKEKLMEEVMKRDLDLGLGLGDGDGHATHGIDALFSGVAMYDCYAFNPRPDLILLMRSVLFHVGRLLEVGEMDDTVRRVIAKYLRDPYMAHLDQIYKSPNRDPDQDLDDDA